MGDDTTIATVSTGSVVSQSVKSKSSGTNRKDSNDLTVEMTKKSVVVM